MSDIPMVQEQVVQEELIEQFMIEKSPPTPPPVIPKRVIRVFDQPVEEYVNKNTRSCVEFTGGVVEVRPTRYQAKEKYSMALLWNDGKGRCEQLTGDVFLLSELEDKVNNIIRSANSLTDPETIDLFIAQCNESRGPAGMQVIEDERARFRQRQSRERELEEEGE